MRLLRFLKALFKYIIWGDQVTTDKYNREGYLIQRDKFYIYQPLDYNDEASPIYYKENPIKSKKKFINIQSELDLEEVIKNKNNNIVDNYNIETEYNKLYKNASDFIKLNNINNYEELLFKSIIYFLNNKLLIKLLKEILTTKFFNNNNLDNSNKIILSICNKYLLYNNKHIILNKKSKVDKIVGFHVGNKYYKLNYKNKTIKEYSKIEIDKIKLNQKILYKNLEKNINKLKKIYGTTELIKNKYIFKIVDKTKEKNAITAEAHKSQRSIIKGRVCDNFNISDLKTITKQMNIKLPNIKLKKPLLCLYIKLFMIYNENNGLWI